LISSANQSQTKPKTTSRAKFELIIDYAVTKIPHLSFEQFPQSDAHARHADKKRWRSEAHRVLVQRKLAIIRVIG